MRAHALVPVHYAGIGCEMDPLLELAKGITYAYLKTLLKAY